MWEILEWLAQQQCREVNVQCCTRSDVCFFFRDFYAVKIYWYIVSTCILSSPHITMNKPKLRSLRTFTVKLTLVILEGQATITRIAVLLLILNFATHGTYHTANANPSNPPPLSVNCAGHPVAKLPARFWRIVHLVPSCFCTGSAGRTAVVPVRCLKSASKGHQQDSKLQQVHRSAAR